MYILIREDRSIFTSAHQRTQYVRKDAAVRQAARLTAAGYYGPIEAMSEDEYYAAGYDKLTRRVRNRESGAWVDEPINTPWHCSVASEAYFCN